MTAQEILRNWAAWRFPGETIGEDARITFRFVKVCEEGWFTEHSFDVLADRHVLRGPVVSAYDINELMEQVLAHAEEE